MSTSLTLPSSHDSKIIPMSVWSDLTTEARKKVDWLRTLCSECAELPRRCRKAGYERIAASTGGLISASTLEDVFLRFEKQGERALIDRRKMKKTGTSQASVLHENTVQEWVRIAELNQHSDRKDQLGTFGGAWEALIRSILDGDKVPGLGTNGGDGTWRDLWVRLNGRKAMPETIAGTRWSLSEPPRGHSLNNFRMRKGPDLESEIASRGGKPLLTKATPMMRMDYTNLQAVRVIQCDDVEINQHVWVENPYLNCKRQCVKVSALVWRCVGTRKVLSVSLHPAFKRPDGSTVGITLRDVQHGLAHVLATVGIPRHWDLVFRMENATATVGAEVKSILERTTDGRVTISHTGVWKGVILPDGFSGSVGKSWQKGALENFNGQLARRMGWAPGQTGGNYTLKPGDLQKRLQDSNNTLAKVGELATEEELRELMAHESLDDMLRRFEVAVHCLETNPNHEMQGFAEVAEWRQTNGGEWMPWNNKLMVELMRDLGTEHVNKVVLQKGCQRMIKETIVQRWDRLYRPADFDKLPFSSLCFLYMDVAAAKWSAVNEVEATLPRGKTYVFRGPEHSCQYGDKVKAHFVAEHPSLGCVLVDEAGIPVGRMEFRRSGEWGDFAWQDGERKDQEAAKVAVMTQIHRRHTNKGKRTARLDHGVRQLNLLNNIAEREGLDAPESAAALSVVNAFDELPAPQARSRRPLPAPVVAHDLDALRAERSQLAEQQAAAPRTAFKWASK